MAEPARYLERRIDAVLSDWSKEEKRKPLLLRGARQVGKSSTVRRLARSFKYFVEVNFDDDKPVHSYFEEANSPQEICEQLALYYRTPVVAGETLLFFDEIQTCIPALSKLRYFYEKYPELHLVAAGSLLEFALEEIPSFGVGRIRSVFMYPFSFEEFIKATGDGMLIKAYRAATPQKLLPEPIHQQLVKRLKLFLIIGGMPEAVAEYVRTGDLLYCQQVLDDLLIAFRNDFAKYKKRVPALRIREVFESVAHQSEGKFVYNRAGERLTNMQVKQALDLLEMAGLVYSVTHTSANGIPLGAETNPKYRRIFMLDTGLFQRVLDLNMSALFTSNDFKNINRGAIAEMFVGLELLKNVSPYKPAQLFCWHREKEKSNAQVDFVVQINDRIVPVEVKSGTKGSMQSLRLFMEEKNSKKGIRTSLENFGQIENIDIYPMYAVSNIYEIRN
jgi:predicted AAA+ superfamily ATPase